MIQQEIAKPTQSNTQNRRRAFCVGFAFLFSVSSALMPLVTSAAGLVPCGVSGQPDCSWCMLMQLFKNVIDFMMYIIFPLAAIMIVYGGILIMTAAGSPGKITKGREIITAAIVGLLIALFSYFIIDTIVKIIAVGWQNANLGMWNQLNCTSGL